MKDNPYREFIPIVVIGAGQAGLSLSYHLSQRGLTHVVLERDRPFASWYERWDSFRVNTPNWMNTLPGLDDRVMPGRTSDGFATKEELLRYLERYVSVVDPPLETGVDVQEVSEQPEGRWLVRTNGTDNLCDNVVICTGAMSNPYVPPVASQIPSRVPQLHSKSYRNPEQISTSSVLIVGSGSSGVQICKDLYHSQRFNHIHFATSNVTVLPRHVFGIQVHRFLHSFRLFDIRMSSLLGKLLYSQLEMKGDPIVRPSARDLGKQYGVHVYGRLNGVEGSRLLFSDGRGLDITNLSVIWCTGFRPDYNWVEVNEGKRLLDSSGYPLHHRGVATEVAGLFFVGLRHQHTAASHDFYGVGDDAAYVADRIYARTQAASPAT